MYIKYMYIYTHTYIHTYIYIYIYINLCTGRDLRKKDYVFTTLIIRVWLGTPSTLQSHHSYVSSMCHLQVFDVVLKLRK